MNSNSNSNLAPNSSGYSIQHASHCSYIDPKRYMVPG